MRPSAKVAVLDKKVNSPRLIHVLEVAEGETERFKSKQTGTEHLLLALLKETDCAAVRLLNTLGVNIQKIYAETLIAMGEDGNQLREEFAALRSGKNLSSEATPTLDMYSRDLTMLAKEGALDPVIGREEEIARVIQHIKQKKQDNPC